MHHQDGLGHDGGGGPPPGSRLAQWSGRSANVTTTSSSTSLLGLNANVPSFIPQFAQMNLTESGDRSHTHSPYAQHMNFPAASTDAEPFVPHQMFKKPPPQENLGGTTYFYPGVGGSGTPNSQSHIDSLLGPQNPTDIEDHTFVHTNGVFAYSGPTPHIGKFRPKGAPGNQQAQFIAPELKIDLLHRQMAIDCRADPTVYPDLPQSVDHLRELVPLDHLPPSMPVPGAPQTTVYKCVSVRDGTPYVIRRIHGFRQVSNKQLAPTESWKKLVHVNICQLRETIITKDFGDTSLLFVYDYHPLAETLKTRHFGRMGGSGFIDSMSGSKFGNLPSGGSMGPGVVESILWSYVVQLSSALRTIHASGLAARSICPSKIIVHGKGKILLSGCAVPDVLQPDHQPIPQQQMEDLVALGRVILALATGNVYAARQDLLQGSLRYVQQHYSSDMKNLINHLFLNGRKSINEIMPMVGARFYAQLEAAQMRNDMLENELSKECENGRLFRLMAKLMTIIERPEFNMDPQWSEQGDRFLLKLFRDYVFHQVMENGRPWTDMAHMVHTLNKLDAGVNEKIELSSRDGENVLIVSYLDLKRCVEQSFRELTSGQGPMGMSRH